MLNKSDLPAAVTPAALAERFEQIATLSAKTGDGRAELEALTERLLGTDNLDVSAPMLTTERQYRCCEAALRALTEALSALRAGLTMDAVNIGLDDAVNALSVLTGERATETVVDEIFSRFCVGK